MVEAVLRVFTTLSSTNNVNIELTPLEENVATGMLGNKRVQSSSYQANYRRKKINLIFKFVRKYFTEFRAVVNLSGERSYV